MTLFELIKIALDELYSQGKAEHGPDLDKIVQEKMSYLTESYHSLINADRVPLSYQDPATRIAYVYSYVTAHADYLIQIFEKFASACEESLFGAKSIRLSCVGGGPGSEILATLKYLSENNEPVEKLTCYLLDGEQAWADTWTELDDSISGNINLKTNFQALNVTKPDSWKYQTNFKNADVFIFSFFISEVYNLDTDGIVTNFVTDLIKDAKSDAFFIYVDNGHSAFNDYFDELCNTGGLSCLISETNVSRIPRCSEQADALSYYTAKFGRMPKLKGYLSYRVLRKLE